MCPHTWPSSPPPPFRGAAGPDGAPRPVPPRSYAELDALPSTFVQQVKATCPDVMELDLRSNALKELPQDLVELKNLRSLRLNYNKFEEVPSIVSSFPKLQLLELSGNQLEAVPMNLRYLTHLKEIDLSGNRFSEFPPVLLVLPVLQSLNLENNTIDKVPDNIDDMKALNKIDLSTNRLTVLPDSFGRMPRIQSVDVSSNTLTMFPATFGRVKGVKLLDVRYNDFDEMYKAKSEEGLFKFMEFLRSEEERLKKEEIERLKPVGITAGSWLEYRVKSALKVSGEEEEDDDEYSNKCTARTGHTITAGNNCYYVFGGTLGDHSKSNELFILDEDRMEWKYLPTTGAIPSAREGHVALFEELSNKFIVFGGRSAEGKRLNDLYLLDLETREWSRPHTDGAIPAAREGASAVMVDPSTLVLFGGAGSGSKLNDVHLFNLATNVWTQPLQQGAIPSPRFGTSIYLSDGLLWIHGGKSNFVLNDTYVLDLETMRWAEVLTDNEGSPCYGHAMHVLRDDEGGFCHIFGGLDEMGNATKNLFLLEYDMVYDEKGDLSIAGKWIELENELHQMPGAACFLPDATLVVLQSGSKTLGIVSEDKEDKSWDVFKNTSVLELKEKLLSAEDLKPKDKKLTHVKSTLESLAQMTLPPNATTLNAKERKMMKYVDKFSRIFTELYPQRRPLLLKGKNEYGTEKIICTTLRPTQLYYLELYDLPTCSRFVSEFLDYQPLSNPLQYPQYIPSPLSILEWQIGDCFDFSILLCSLLVAVGYDAYCVCGYAPKDVTVYDKSRTECPYVDQQNRTGIHLKKKERRKARKKAEKKSKYDVVKETVLESKYLKGMAEKDAAAAAMIANEPSDLSLGPERDVPEDELAGKRVHCWVMVLAGKREVAQNIFVEPSSGQIYEVTESPYEGVEFLWNDKNFWANLQLPEQHSDSRSDQKTLSLDLKDGKAWEALLLEEAAEAEAEDREAAEQVPGAEAARAAEGPAEKEEPPPPEKGSSVDMPESWVQQLKISPEQYDMRCHRGMKVVNYRKCVHEVFARYGEYARWDGMVERLTLFADEECSQVHEVREWFERRRDRLTKRLSYVGDDTVEEYFEAGASFGLKDMKTIGHDTRIINFYHTARLDGLASREEKLGDKTIEIFKDRDDYLVYRSVSYDSDGTPEAKRLTVRSGRTSRGVNEVEDDVQYPIRKAAQKYAINPEVDAARQVAKRTFFITADQVRMDFHYGADRITASSRLYTKEGLSHITEVDPLRPKPKESQLLEEYQSLLIAEKECIQSVRDMERETREILATRKREEQNIQLLMPYYDIVRLKTEESDDEKEQEQQVQHDYLSSFLPASTGNRALTRNEAIEVRESCLKALTDRLIERANIIQTRHDEESAALAKRQTTFQRDRDQMSRAEEEEYERSVEETLFRIHIFEQRLKRHEEQALQKYYDLDMKLRSEPRLAALSFTG